MKKIAILLVLFLFGCKSKPKLPDPELPLSSPIILEIPSIKIIEENPVGESVAEKSGIVHLKFKLGNINSIGTGFFIKHKNKKYLLTAAHNVGFANKLNVFRNSGSVKVKILKYKIHRNCDLAMFLIETKETCFELEDPKKFDGIPDYGKLYKPSKYKPIKIEMYGYPDEWHFRKVEGTIYQTIKFLGTTKILVSTGKCSGGMSGGPWFNKENNKVVALHTLQLFGDSSGGIPSDKIIKLLNKMEKDK